MERVCAAPATEPVQRCQTSARTGDGAGSLTSCSTKGGQSVSKAEEIKAAQKRELKQWRDNFTQEHGRPPGKEDIARDEKIGGKLKDEELNVPDEFCSDGLSHQLQMSGRFHVTNNMVSYVSSALGLYIGMHCWSNCRPLRGHCCRPRDTIASPMKDI